MSANMELRIPGDIEQAERILKEAYRDHFGSNGFTAFMTRGKFIIRSKRTTDESTAQELGGGTLIGLLETSDELRSTVEAVAQDVTGEEMESPEEEVEEPTGTEIPEREREVIERAEREVDKSEAPGEGEVKVYRNGAIGFMPPFTKNEADYIEQGDATFDPDHNRCKTCAHYIEGGGCNVVQGGIDPNAYCDEFYADVGIFAHQHMNFVELNLIAWGERFDWGQQDVDDFLDRLDGVLDERVGRL